MNMATYQLWHMTISLQRLKIRNEYGLREMVESTAKASAEFGEHFPLQRNRKCAAKLLSCKRGPSQFNFNK